MAAAAAAAAGGITGTPQHMRGHPLSMLPAPVPPTSLQSRGPPGLPPVATRTAASSTSGTGFVGSVGRWVPQGSGPSHIRWACEASGGEGLGLAAAQGGVQVRNQTGLVLQLCACGGGGAVAQKRSTSLPEGLGLEEALSAMEGQVGSAEDRGDWQHDPLSPSLCLLPEQQAWIPEQLLSSSSGHLSLHASLPDIKAPKQLLAEASQPYLAASHSKGLPPSCAPPEQTVDLESMLADLLQPSTSSHHPRAPFSRSTTTHSLSSLLSSGQRGKGRQSSGGAGEACPSPGLRAKSASGDFEAWCKKGCTAKAGGGTVVRRVRVQCQGWRPRASTCSARDYASVAQGGQGNVHLLVVLSPKDGAKVCRMGCAELLRTQSSLEAAPLSPGLCCVKLLEAAPLSPGLCCVKLLHACSSRSSSYFPRELLIPLECDETISEPMYAGMGPACAAHDAASQPHASGAPDGHVCDAPWTPDGC